MILGMFFEKAGVLFPSRATPTQLIRMHMEKIEINNFAEAGIRY
jgi:hypothetical protein